MSHFKNLKDSGFTMVELTVTMALTGVLAMIVYGVVQYADRQTKIQTEDIQNLIQRFGASKVLLRDLTNAAPTFNYINVKDDNDRPFFILSTTEFCQHANCERKFTMSIPNGETVSRPLFFLVINGMPNEIIRFGIDPEKLFDDSEAYLGINSDPDNDISKAAMPISPWDEDRLILLQTSNQFYDCHSQVHTFEPNPSGSCPITCQISGTCNYAINRPLKLLGKVNSDKVDMTFLTIPSRPELLKNKFSLCNPKNSSDCEINVDFGTGLTTSKDLIEKMPYIPGSDNMASFTPVSLVRYHLERPSASSPDNKIVLMRSTAEIVGTQLSFERAHVLLTGIQSIVFTRKNVSNPTIEYKLNKVRLQQVVK